MGVVSLAQDLGSMLSRVVYSDSGAALRIASRQGLGKLWHIKVQCIWLQERVAEEDLKVRKGLGETSHSDFRCSEETIRQALREKIRII